MKTSDEAPLFDTRLPAATIRLTRVPRGRRDRLRAYSILVDAQVMATIRPGQTIELPVAAGTHSVQMTIDWARSPTLTLDLAPGEIVDLRCAPNTAQGALVGATFGRGKYVRLWRAQASEEDEGLEELLPLPRVRLVLLLVLLAVLGLAIAHGRIFNAVVVALLALPLAAVIGAWVYAKTRGSGRGHPGERSES